MSKPPAYISHVEMNAIVVASLDRATAKRLQDAGVDIKRSWFGDGRVAIKPPADSGESSPDEEDKLMQLARQGIAFASDYKQGMDPVGMMLSLIERGRYVGTFKEIVWTGPEHWQLRTLPAPERIDRR